MHTPSASNDTSSANRLPRVLGPIGAMAVVVGSVIGSGIFFKATIIAKSLGRLDAILLAWFVCGLLSLLGALALAELGAMLPHAGGQYVFLREAFGPMPAFLWGWIEFWMTRSGSIAALAVAFSMAFYRAFGEWFVQQGWVLQRGDELAFVLGGAEISKVWMLRLIAIVMIVVLTGLNYVGTAWGGRMQNVTTFLKVGSLLALMVLPFVTGAASSDHLFSKATNYVPIGAFAGFAAAMTAVFWAYDGWANLGPMAEEIHHPQRNVPLALGGGLLALIGLYVGATLAYHWTLTMDEIAASDFVAATACAKMLGPHGATIASVAVMISTLGALNGNILISPRIIFAMARDGAFFPAAAKVHPRYRTPHLAIVTMSAWSIVLICSSDLVRQIPAIGEINWLPSAIAEPLARSLNAMRDKAIYDILTDFVVFGAFVFSLLAVAAVFVLRRKHPEWERPYQTFGYPVLPIVFLVGSAGFLVGMLLTSPVESCFGLAFIASGWVVFRATIGRAR